MSDYIYIVEIRGYGPTTNAAMVHGYWTKAAAIERVRDMAHEHHANRSSDESYCGLLWHDVFGGPDIVYGSEVLDQWAHDKEHKNSVRFLVRRIKMETPLGALAGSA